MTKTTTPTPAELNATFASGDAKRASDSAKVMAALFPKRAKNGVYPTMANPKESATVSDAGYSQSSQTLAQWASVGAIVAAMGKSADDINQDNLSNAIFADVCQAPSVKARAALLEEWSSKDADELGADLTEFATDKGKGKGKGKTTPPKKKTYNEQLLAKLDAVSEILDSEKLGDLKSSEFEHIVSRMASMYKLIQTVRESGNK